MRPWPILAVLLSLPAVARADGSAALRVTDQGLAWLADEVVSQVPPETEIDDVEYGLADCWPSDSRFELSQGQLALDDVDLSFPLGQAELGMELQADVRASGTALLDAIGCLPLSVSCDVAIVADAVRMSGSLVARPGALALGGVEIEVDPASLELELTSCTGDIEEVLESVYEQLEPAILDLLRSRLETWIDQEVRPRIDQALAATLAIPIDMANVDATVRMGTAMVGADAVELVAWVGLAPRELSACVPQTAPELEADGGVELTDWDPSPFALGVSERVLDEGMLATWQSGLMCFEPHDLSAFDGLIEGLPEGVDFQVAFTLEQPPDVELTPDGVDVTVDGVSAAVHYQSAGGAGDAVIEGSAAARASLEIDPATNGIRFRITDPVVGEMDLASGELPPGADLGPFIDEIVFPMLLDFVGDLRVLDAVIPVSDYWVIGNAIDYHEGSASLAFELFAEPETDEIGPDTFVREAPRAFVAPGEGVRIVVGGSDDLVPERLLRYQIREEDGGDYSEPTFSPTFTIRKYDTGAFAYEVRAIDLAGNVDPDPAKITIEVEEVSASGDHRPALPPPEDESEADARPAGPDPVEGGCFCSAGGSGGGAGAGILVLLFALGRVCLGPTSPTSLTRRRDPA
ncbi:MAG: hypothetical protein HYY06_28075 [Deltaproteobacteria bacterium]|nr:hypothetical protein [Deltaproteobacteria bacterium]